MNDQQQLADNYSADRAAQLHDFFRDFSLLGSDGDPSWMAEREHDLQITAEEWDNYRAEKAAKYAAIAREF